MSLFNKTKPSESPTETATVSTEELKAQIDQNRYSEDDTVEQLFGKYDALCLLEMENLDKPQKTMVHQAKLLFVNSIQPPKEDKQAVLDFIIHALPHARTSTAQDALQAVSKIGFGALKTVSVAGKVATLGMGGKVLDNVEKVANKALQTGALELVNVWRQKLETSFKNAKKLEGGLLSKDKEFANSLSDLRKQYESA